MIGLRAACSSISQKRLWRSPLLVALAMTSGCVTAPQRPAASSYGCMAAVRDSLPATLPDKRAHCLAASLIAQRCSRIEAYMASIGKELSDALGSGDPEWADWQADRAGLRCAQRAEGEALTACCESEGY